MECCGLSNVICLSLGNPLNMKMFKPTDVLYNKQTILRSLKSLVKFHNHHYITHCLKTTFMKTSCVGFPQIFITFCILFYHLMIYEGFCISGPLNLTDKEGSITARTLSQRKEVAKQVVIFGESLHAHSQASVDRAMYIYS